VLNTFIWELQIWCQEHWIWEVEENHKREVAVLDFPEKGSHRQNIRQPYGVYAI
jgi:hypothetical protein